MPIESKKSKILSHKCQICGVPAEYSYFGVISCDACKIFFRRNAKAGQTTFVCNFDGQCEININTRHICSSCRLVKCFKCGMSTDKFRSPRQSKPKTKALVKIQIQHQPEILPTLNLLRSDQSLLTTNQWTLFSNLFNCYKESQILSFTQRLLDTHNTSQLTYVAYEALVEEFLGSVYEAAGAYLCGNGDLRELSSNDRPIMLHSAADNVTCMGGSFIMQHCCLYDLDTFLNIMNNKYGKSTMDIHVWARKFIGSDVALAKLGISLFAFSENTCCYHSNISRDLTNSVNIFKIQNKYAEVTWKYLLYKYGHHEAVKQFLKLTLWIASMNILSAHAQSLAIHIKDISAIIEKTEMTLILDDDDQIIEKN